MSLDSLHYRTARCLNVIPRGENYEITHELNGRKFVLPRLAYQLLTHLKEPTTIEELLDRTSTSFPSKEVQTMLNRLRKGGVIVATGDDETYHRRLPNKTLMGIPAYHDSAPEDLQNRRLVLLGVPFGSGNKLDGACAKFPAKIRWFTQSYLSSLHARNHQLDFRGFGADNSFFTSLREWLASNRLTDGGDLVLQSNEYPSSVYAKVERLTEEINGKGNVPIMLGGDHSLTFPAIAGVARQHEAIQIIQFDAHTDTYVNRVAELYAGSGKAPHHHGNFLSNALKSTKIAKVWQFGIRGPFTMTPPKDARCKIVYAHEIPDFLQSNSVQQLDPDLPTYLTFDIDFFDPTVAPGTATPVIDGPGYRTGLDLLATVLDRVNVVGADLMEVNPDRDRDDQTIQVAVSTLLRLINGIKM
ncbi:arginase family protein [Neolewinella agarilytica]|uniref:arginase family protein n=1 Tax=Neolewinella agarilytica TaxID=478744 RepID=UPI0023524A52|nr:arginase family protein [Neolewinella agarilytica]